MRAWLRRSTLSSTHERRPRPPPGPTPRRTAATLRRPSAWAPRPWLRKRRGRGCPAPRRRSRPEEEPKSTPEGGAPVGAPGRLEGREAQRPPGSDRLMRDNRTTVDPGLDRSQAASSGVLTHGPAIPCECAESCRYVHPQGAAVRPGALRERQLDDFGLDGGFADRHPRVRLRFAADDRQRDRAEGG
jgi:hypothetical protein